jgi:hypothetical protein
MNTPPRLVDAIGRDGFAFAPAAEMRPLLADAGSLAAPLDEPLADWPDFVESWNDLGPDTYMADGGRYRKRRYGVFAVTGDAIVRQPHQPHYQSRDYNVLNGGIERWFQPILPEIGNGPTMTAVLMFCRGLFGSMAASPSWHAEVHQFRIEARRDEAGRPTPEGMHRDGHDYVLVLMINRTNIASGVTSIHDLDGRSLGDFTLTEPLDAALVDDRKVTHGVTPVAPLDPALPGHRDVLVVTFHRKAGA